MGLFLDSRDRIFGLCVLFFFFMCYCKILNNMLVV